MKHGAGIKDRATQVIEWALPYWTRGPAGRQTPPDLLRVLYFSWIVAFVLKVLGASWDVSWHFKWLRDDFAPPHLINSVGTAIVVALTIIHGYTGYGVDRAAQRLIQWGTGIFLIAIPIDLINHRVNGIDITSWSPSHVLLYVGTAFMIAGVIRGWHVSAPPGRLRTLVLGGLFVFLLENVLFPSEHQEYGVLSLAAWDRGVHYAEPILLNFAADQMGRSVDRGMVEKFTLPVPDWVYPMWFGVAAVLVLVVARMLVGRRWTATAVAGVYVAFRTILWPLLYAMNFPPSAVPFFLLAVAVCVDVAFMLKIPLVRAVGGAVLVTAAVYGGLMAQDAVLDAPPFPLASAPVSAVLLAGAWLGVEWYARRRTRGPEPVLPPVGAPATP
ncbi:hypothetical protein Skr01_28160 [Sphaerisporangium krabiense]|uniref:Uncharacterized protein n=1 Tax=Sphaerisporangium krabiense TaxID=763782 RepID=A0A7W8ZAB6_9ACTN|nr:hypothetical protein [Sphaerisporangium krabiense]MBB5630318.1 hypothetical protein [Sphaerisporangium krabiense]GII62731.1 hypothetical protein Skr01_28160 [Sphaerisporangium krabiense]